MMISSTELADLCHKEAETPSGIPCVVVHKSRDVVMGVYCSHPALAGLPVVFIDSSEFADKRAELGREPTAADQVNFIRLPLDSRPDLGVPYTVLVARADPAKVLVDAVCALTRDLSFYLASKLAKPRLNLPPSARLSELDRRLDEASFRPDPDPDPLRGWDNPET